MSGMQTHLTIFASKLGASLLIMAVFWVGSTIVKKVIQRVSQSQDPARQDVVNLLAEIARLALLVFGVVTALGTVGVNVSALVAGLGLTGFALGFAFRDALSNILAGVLIVFYHPFRRGDHLAVMGLEGIVTGIDLRYTTLKREDKTFLIPNATLFTNPLSLTHTVPSSTEAIQPPDPSPARSAASRAQVDK